MKSATIWKFLAALVVLTVVFVAASNALVYWGFQELDLSHPSPGVRTLEVVLKQLDKLARAGAFPRREVNHSSVGSGPAESKLIELRRDMGIYESRHQRLPVDFAELLSSGFPPDWKDHLEKFEKECEIVSLTPDSCILNCDGWALPGANDVETLVHSFDPRTERFYKVEKHVLLYVPPPTRGNPAKALQEWNERVAKPGSPTP